MLHMDRSQDTHPWYRQFWPWFLIAIPAAAVLGGLLTLFLALHEPDGLVEEDYYKKGLAVNQDLSRERVAAALGLEAQVRLPGEAVMSVALRGRYPVSLEALRVRFVHPTRAHQDVSAVLHAGAAGVFAGPIATLAPGRWHVVIEPPDASWRLTGRISVPGERSVTLLPELAG